MGDLTLIIESYLKGTVNLGLFESLDDAGKGKFFDKCTIELTLRHAPKKNYGVSKEDFRGFIIDVFVKLYYGNLRLDTDNLKAYCYRTCFKQHRLVMARTKKKAIEIACSFGFDVNGLATVSSLRKVSELRFGPETNIAVLDNGEEIEIKSLWLQTVNLFDGCIDLWEGGAQ